ncbi:5-methylcytosine-specific restriction endonuclease subunit McrB [Pseudophaeobacter arcticus]|uniref:5-methylcytosine-specific restriction endonuclease subunit McrB n=1 Tax=Pseudophaeobacter arcticus TaxID=385492 RepID=A0ABQ0AS93_9RHOB
MGFDLVNEVFEYLKDRTGQQLTANDIAEHIYQSFPEYIEDRTLKSASRNKSRDLTSKEGWVSQISAEIGSKNPIIRSHPQIEVIETRPKQYSFSPEKVKKFGAASEMDHFFSKRLNSFLEAFNERRDGPFSIDEDLSRAMSDLKGWVEETHAVSSRPQLEVKISVGKGNWAKSPWIAILDKDVTTSTQSGIYVVFLIREDLSTTYLTLNQGMTKLTNTLGDAAAVIEMKRVAEAVKPNIENLEEEGFTLDNAIDLRASSKATKKYEAGTIAHLALPNDAIPDDGAIEHFLDQLLNAYKTAIGVDVEIAEAPEEPLSAATTSLSEPYSIGDALGELFLEREEVERHLEIWANKKNLILQGAPGVGKSFIARRLAYALIGFRDNRKVQTVQFHQSYSYEDFVQGYRPNGNQGFDRKNGSFYEFCNRAVSDPGSRYVFIIDEINRGNLSKIFGELMLLIEPDKRNPMWSTRLAYATENDPEFYVPANLYILGMMNTADRSLSLVDYALRRRFAFVAMEPLYGAPKFQKHLEKHGVSESVITQIKLGMSELNQTIESDRTNLGPGFRIGHSFFTPTQPVINSEAWYRRIVETEIHPLLEEYWFDSPENADQWRDRLLG